MSLAGKKIGWSFWGTLTPSLVNAALLAAAAAYTTWKGIDPQATPFGVPFWVPVGLTVAAGVLGALDRFFAGKKRRVGASGVAEVAFSALMELEKSVQGLMADDGFDRYSHSLVEGLGPKLFREREVRIGFYLLEAGESESEDMNYLKLRAGYDHGGGLPILLYADKVEDGKRDHAREMIERAESIKDLVVPNIYRNSPGWIRLEGERRDSYSCFITAPVLDSKHEKPLGILTVDAPNARDLTTQDKKWVRMVARLLSHGLVEEMLHGGGEGDRTSIENQSIYEPKVPNPLGAQRH